MNLNPIPAIEALASKIKEEAKLEIKIALHREMAEYHLRQLKILDPQFDPAEFKQE